MSRAEGVPSVSTLELREAFERWCFEQERLLNYSDDDKKMPEIIFDEFLGPAIEALSDIEKHSPESIDKVVLLLNIDGYRERARRALAAIRGKLK